MKLNFIEIIYGLIANSPIVFIYGVYPLVDDGQSVDLLFNQ